MNLAQAGTSAHVEGVPVTVGQNSHVRGVTGGISTVNVKT
jgi:hypothetical protein